MGDPKTKGSFQPVSTILAQEPTLAVVLGDFGRDAALRFCLSLADFERRHLCRRLGERAFFDEYRRITLALVGDLPLVKRRCLSERRLGDGLDERVLVGFPGGVPLAEVLPGLCALILEALAGPVRRGRSRAVVLLPCNTLAPASWALADAFGTAAGIRALLARGGPELAPLGEQAEAALERCRPRFPTVPEAVIRHVVRRGGRRVLPLGTGPVAEIYAEAARRAQAAVSIVAPTAEQQGITLQAILASISGDAADRGRARHDLEQMAAAARGAHGDQLWVVEACTDLDYRVGLASMEVYAEAVVEEVYGADP